MTPHERRRRLRLRRIRITGWTALTSLLVTLVGFLTYFHIVFPADRDATLEVFRDDRVQVRASDARVVMSPTDELLPRGLLYFPGARVDPYSYLYPLADIAAAGTTVVIVDPCSTWPWRTPGVWQNSPQTFQASPAGLLLDTPSVE